MQLNHLGDYLARNAQQVGAKTALVTDDNTLSWQQLHEQVAKRVDFFSQALSHEHQEIVATVMPNSWQLVVTYLAIIEAGHIAMPLDVIYKPLELEAILRQMAPKMTIVDEGNKARLKNAEVILFSDIDLGDGESKRLKLAADKQIASLVFTSGTTGKPKAAPYTHSNHIWNIKVCSQAWGWNENDTMLLSIRLAHWYGICMGLSGSLYHGSTLYLEDRFDPSKTLERLSQGDITLFTHIPLAYAKMLEIEGDYDLSHLRLPISGSAALAPDIWKNFKERFGLEIIECYGSSETGRIASNTYDERLVGSPGKLLDDVEAKLSEAGELLVKSPGLFPGYYNNPSATAKNLDGEGYWHTGDLAEIKDNHVTLKGRLVERIRKQGYSVSPRDVEWALRENPLVQDCFVLGTNDDSDNSLLVYFVVGQIDKEAVQDYVKQNLPSIWRPDKIIMLDAIPRTSNGKPNLPQLRSMVS